ncbi:MAG: phosphoribosylamine--glycine ligase [Polyangiaceae bacterium]|nr:phosphoribosylamine--glycine ligase [Polyangiaceae bacterium]
MRRTVLVVGSGGREHALALRLLASESVDHVVVAPGNAGTTLTPAEWSKRGKTLRSTPLSPLELARSERIDLAVVGPEVPLCAGLSDQLQSLGVRTYGPSAMAARLEGSKAFMKRFADRNGIPTAPYEVVTSLVEAHQARERFDEFPVLKADGLCAGKGVVLASDPQELEQALDGMLSGRWFGEAGRTVLLEQRLAGSEVSVHAICDGERAFVLPMVQDHKRIGDGDCGPNTGGMGAYGPAPLVTPELFVRLERDFVDKIVEGMAADGAPFRGTLFAGLMITSDGEPSLLEINVRFGDPETQVLMNLLDGDLADVLDLAAQGCLSAGSVATNDLHALCVVLAAAGYPGPVRSGDVITAIEAAEAVEGVHVYHAGTRRVGDELHTAGGRVLGVTARASTLQQAQQRAYQAASCVRFGGMQMRRDIGARALGTCAP